MGDNAPGHQKLVNNCKLFRVFMDHISERALWTITSVVIVMYGLR